MARQGEADLSAPFPAAADPSEALGHAGHKESQAAQQDQDGKDQDQDEGGGQVEAVLGRIESSIPPENERVGGGHEQGAVTKC